MEGKRREGSNDSHKKLNDNYASFSLLEASFLLLYGKSPNVLFKRSLSFFSLYNFHEQYFLKNFLHFCLGWRLSKDSKIYKLTDDNVIVNLTKMEYHRFPPHISPFVNFKIFEVYTTITKLNKIFIKKNYLLRFIIFTSAQLCDISSFLSRFWGIYLTIKQ